MRRAILITLTSVCIAALNVSLAQVQDEPTSARKIVTRVQPQYPALGTRSARYRNGQTLSEGQRERQGCIHRRTRRTSSTGPSGNHGGEPVEMGAVKPATQETVIVKFSQQE